MKELIWSRKWNICLWVFLFCGSAGMMLWGYTRYTTKDKKFVIVIPSYNNALWCEKNIIHALSQKYEKFRILFVDDCSSDTTADMVEAAVKQHDVRGICTIIRNNQRVGALANIYNTVHSCAPDEIIVLCDGDDWFFDDLVLERLNQVYQNTNVWLTYGQFVTYPENSLGICRPLDPDVIKNKTYRSALWVTSHLRTFYAGLFCKIDLNDLQYDHEFFDVTWDMALLFPMLEMADGRVAFIPDILYVYNQANPINDFKKKLSRVHYFDRLIRNKQRYEPITSWQI